MIYAQAYFCLLNKLTTFIPFAMYGIVGKVNNNALLVRSMLY